MKKYKVYGTTVVTVTKEVWANDEYDAINKASDELSSLTEYCGNGGYDKLVGVEEYNESVSVDGYIEWNDTEMMEDNPDYMECPNCGDECYTEVADDGKKYWWCDCCCQAYDENGEEIYLMEDEE